MSSVIVVHHFKLLSWLNLTHVSFVLAGGSLAYLNCWRGNRETIQEAQFLLAEQPVDLSSKMPPE
jgi:hypothetical protein